MRLLIDTDAFCKLSIGGILHESLGLFRANLSDCGRLAALPYMLERGRLRKAYGQQNCDALVPVARQIPIMVQASDPWLEKLALVPSIDPGEAQIFASAAEKGLIVLTGDKRALNALKEIGEFVTALSGRVTTVEQLVLALHDSLGEEAIKRRIQPLLPFDAAMRVCFSSGNPDVRSALESYIWNLESELAPLTLWKAPPGGTP